MNDDLISRQQALDIAFKYCPDDDGTCSEAGSDMRNMLDEIEALPPAQSEITLESAIDYLHSIGWMQEHDRILSESAQPELIMCKDCKFADREATSSNGMYWCIFHGSYMRYCSDATRRTDADMRGEQNE